MRRFSFAVAFCRGFSPIVSRTVITVRTHLTCLQAYEFFNEGQEGHDACVAFFSLTAIGSIDTMIANFLTSLQTLADDKKRVHGSLNINTET